MGFLMLPHPLTNFESEKYQNEPRFNGVFSRNNLPKKIKDGAYVINLDEYADVGTHCLAIFCNRSEIVYLQVKNWEKRSNNFVLFQRWMKLTEQTWLIRQN